MEQYEWIHISPQINTSLGILIGFTLVIESIENVSRHTETYITFCECILLALD